MSSGFGHPGPRFPLVREAATFPSTDRLTTISGVGPFSRISSFSRRCSSPEGAWGVFGFVGAGLVEGAALAERALERLEDYTTRASSPSPLSASLLAATAISFLVSLGDKHLPSRLRHDASAPLYPSIPRPSKGLGPTPRGIGGRTPQQSPSQERRPCGYLVAPAHLLLQGASLHPNRPGCVPLASWCAFTYARARHWRCV